MLNNARNVFNVFSNDIRTMLINPILVCLLLALRHIQEIYPSDPIHNFDQVFAC